MQIIIDIDKELFNKLPEAELGSNVIEDVLEAVENRTIIPKGHGRLKDENEIKQMIEDAKVKNESSKNFAENIIRFASTIIEADTEK